MRLVNAENIIFRFVTKRVCWNVSIVLTGVISLLAFNNFAEAKNSAQRILVLLVSVRDIDNKCNKLTKGERGYLNVMLKSALKNEILTDEERESYTKGIENPSQIDCASINSAAMVAVFREMRRQVPRSK